MTAVKTTMTKMMTKIRSNSDTIKLIVALILVICALSYGLSLVIPFLHAFAIFSGIIIPGTLWYRDKISNETSIIAEYETELARLDGVLTQVLGETEELKMVVAEYEEIFDSQVAEIPCNCNDNVFRGIFSPSLDNIVECDKCKNKYKVTMNYDTVLMTEPLDNDAMFHSLKTSLQ